MLKKTTYHKNSIRDYKNESPWYLKKTYTIVFIFFLVLNTHQLMAVSNTNNYKKISSKYNCNTTLNTQLSIKPVQSGLWSQASTWANGVQPSLNDDVVIPEGITLTMLGVCKAKSITVMGTLNAINSRPNNASFSLETKYIMVMGGNSLLEIGTENQYYQSKEGGVITLIGSDPSELIPNTSVNSKAIMAMNGGEIQIHGKPKLPWTQLNTTAKIGASSIKVKEAVNWEVGDKIVITPSGFQPGETETKTITQISDDKMTLTLDTVLLHRHYGEINYYKNGELDFDLRAEVGLLSHNITIQGDATSESNGYGGHMMTMSGTTAKVSGVTLFRMGQEGIVGRYPFHWHLVEDATGQYIKNSSVHKSFNRAITIHGTDNTLVEGVVAYDFISHGFFLEDGDEEGNIFKDNLGVFARKAKAGKLVRPFDVDPSVFWITNPNNTWIGNVAAASQKNGFWFLPVTTPLRDGNWGDYNPRELTIKLFKDNVGHSNNGFNVGIDNTINATTLKIQTELSYTPYKQDRTVDTVYVDNFRGYHARQQSYWSRMAGPDVLRNSKVGGSKEQVFQSFHGKVENTLIVGKFNGFNYDDMSNVPPEYLGAQMYNGSTDFENIHLAGFNDDNTSCIGTRRSSGKYPNFTIKGVTFEDDIPIKKRVKFDGNGIEHPGRSYNHASGLIDLDGSLTGVTGARLTPRIKDINVGRFKKRIFDEGFNITPNATLIEEWNAYYTTNTEFGLYFTSNSLRNYTDDNVPPHYIIRSDGPAVFDFRAGAVGVHYSPILNNSNYKYNMQLHSLPLVTSGDLRWVNKNSFSYTNYLNIPSGFTVKGATAVSSLQELEAANENAYWFKDNTVYTKNVANNVSSIQNTSVLYTDYNATPIKLCMYQDCNKSFTSDGLGQIGVTLIDYEMGDDSRDELIMQSGLQTTALIYDANDPSINPFDNIDDGVNFSITTDGDGIDEYVDYKLTFPRQVWSEFYTMGVNYTGPNVTLLLDNSQDEFYYLGEYQSNDSNNISMQHGSNLDLKDNVVGVILRIFESDISSDLNASVTENILIKGITLSPVEPNIYSEPIIDSSGLDSDGDGMADIDETQRCRNAYNPIDLSFGFNGSLDEFNAQQISQVDLQSGEYLNVTVNQSDPKLIKSNLKINGNLLNKIKVRYKSDKAGRLQLFWRNNNGGFSSSRVINTNYTQVGEWQEVVFDLSSHSQWINNIITDLRLDLPPGSIQNYTAQVDWIRGPNGGVNDFDDNGICNHLDDIDGDTMTDEDEISNCRDFNNAADLNFQFMRTNEGFQAVNIDSETLTISSIYILKANFQEDPYIVKEGFSFDGNQIPQLILNARSRVSGFFQLYWKKEGDIDFTESRSISSNNRKNIYENHIFELKDHPEWKDQKIVALRIDLPKDVTREVETNINYLRTGVNTHILSPNTPVLANIVAPCEVTSLTAPTATDTCGNIIFGTHNMQLPITAKGNTVVVWIFDDGNGNVGTQEQTVVIERLLNPVFDQNTIPEDITVYSDSNFTYILEDFTANSIANSTCGDPVIITQSPEKDTALGIGEHIISITAQDIDGNKQKVTFVINVEESPTLSLSAEEFDKEIFKMYPNPTSGEVYISGSFKRIIIYTQLGQEVLKSSSNSFSISNLESGIYFVLIETKKGNSIKKLTKL